MGQKQKRIRPKEQQDQAEEQERRYRKVASSPETPDKGEASEILGTPALII